MPLCQNNKNKEYQIKLSFGKQKGKKVIVNFKDGQIISDAGVLLLSGINQKYHLTEKISNSLEDQRDQHYTKLEQLIAQRLFQTCLQQPGCLRLRGL